MAVNHAFQKVGELLIDGLPDGVDGVNRVAHNSSMTDVRILRVDTAGCNSSLHSLPKKHLLKQ